MVQLRAPTTFLSDGIANRLLISLPNASLKRLQPALELRATAKSEVVKRIDRPVEHYYFGIAGGSHSSKPC